MASSVTLTFVCLTLLLLHPAQGQKGRTESLGVDCCLLVSEAQINKPVKMCHIQRAHTFHDCQIDAYIFRSVDDVEYCVDPNSWWLKQRIEKLQANGVHCVEVTA